MENSLEDLMYQAGLTAQGSWDEMDQYNRDAVLKLVSLVLDQCIDLVEQSGRSCQHTTFDKSIVDCVHGSAVQSIKQHFNIKESKGLWHAKS